MELNGTDQPCQNFRAHEISPFHGEAIAHECFTCEGSRYFCANCHTDHHSDGWQPCWDIKRLGNARKPLGPLANLSPTKVYQPMIAGPVKCTEYLLRETAKPAVTKQNYRDTVMTYKITYTAQNRPMVFAGGFASIERAQRWLELYNTQNGIVSRPDLAIVSESAAV